jgi:stearoyl-CoA desaturase (delta-9 desaturase)
MLDTLLDFLANGLSRASWGEMVVYLLVLTQLTIFTVTLYYHRSATHRGVDFHWTLNGFFRFWGWLTTGMVVREWVAIHRKHHAKVETEEDPHSPQVFGIKKVFFDGVALYREASYNKADMEKYGRGTPDDWFERKLFGSHPYWGPTLMAIINVSLFGVVGLAIWAIQMIWIPFWAAGFVNGIGHWWGYRNFESSDTATNISLRECLVSAAYAEAGAGGRGAGRGGEAQSLRCQPWRAGRDRPRELAQRRGRRSPSRSVRTSTPAVTVRLGGHIHTNGSPSR